MSFLKNDISFIVVVKGRIVPQLMEPAHELSTCPIFVGANPPNKTQVAGIAWANVDSTCRLNYKVCYEEHI